MRVFKFSELSVGDKFVSSSAFLKGPSSPSPFGEEEDLVLMEKVSNDAVTLCYNGRSVTRFPSITPCVRIRT